MKALVLAAGLAAVAVSGSAMADLDLAKKSGCLACHSVDKNVRVSYASFLLFL